MYARHFGLAGDPFSIAPDPRFLFMSAAHREALGHLLYGLQGGGGFVLLTGEIGTGKTTVCRAFLEQLPTLHPRVEVAYVLNPRVNATELLQTVCEEFGLAPQGQGLKPLVDALNAHLLAQHAAGGRSLLVIDEAQNLSADVLEQLRLLTNLETHERKLLQIVLVGQPELRDMLGEPALEQLAQRVIARFHLGTLTAEDSRRYLAHRLAVAGHRGALPFDEAAMTALAQLSGGVPRRLNLLADRALLGAYAGGALRVDRRIVKQAAAEVMGTTAPSLRWRAGWRTAAVAGGGLLAGAAAAWALAAWLAPAMPPATPLATGASAGPEAATPPMPTGAAAATAGTATAAAATEPAPAAAASAVPATATATAVLPDLPPVSDDNSGWRALAAWWGVPDAAPCPTPAATLRCFRAATFTLAQIRELDRPGLVTLREGEARTPRVALLGAADARQVLLLTGSERLVLTPAEFGTRWQGDFATLWRARGEPEARATAEWMAAQLQAIQGLAASSAGGATDRVKAFQRAHGLTADGVPGALTLMQLNRALGVAEPRLLR